MLLRSSYYASEPTKEEAAFELFRDEIDRHVESNAILKAQEMARKWASWLSDDLKLPTTSNWKIFKRSLVARWFGSPEKRVFKPKWQPGDIVQYATSLLPRNVRVSSFPDGIACHAQSERLPTENTSEWSKLISRLPPTSVVEVFPESSSITSVCFRRCSGALGEQIRYEASSGQAMAAFESEQGKHPVITALLTSEQTQEARILIPSCFPKSEVSMIKRRLLRLLANREPIISTKCKCLCRMSGIPWLGIEGYYDFEQRERLTIVDIDLPFDFVFMLV